VLTWGGLRGGISDAMALSLRLSADRQGSQHREFIVAMTEVVVVASILI
jgi:NhaP-type Na+/H+ or K+/H+ antiporter